MDEAEIDRVRDEIEATLMRAGNQFIGRRVTEARRYKMERAFVRALDGVMPPDTLPPPRLPGIVDRYPDATWEIVSHPRLRCRRRGARLLPRVRPVTHYTIRTYEPVVSVTIQVSFN